MSKNIESHLNENRVIKPSKQFSRNARIGSLAEYKRLHKESIKSPSKFWGREAGELKWQKKWNKVLEWKAPFAKWFTGGKINAAENCVDRHLTGPVRIRQQLSGRVNLAKSALSPMLNCTRRSVSSQMSLNPAASKNVTA